MKKHDYLIILLLCILTTFSSCSSDESVTPDVTKGDISITITDPKDVTNGIKTKQGNTLEIKLTVDAEDGLSTVSVENTKIKTYTGNEKSDSLTYSFLAQEEGTTEVVFRVEDAKGNTKEARVSIVIEAGEDLGFLLVDFAGKQTGTLEETIGEVPRDIITFNVSGKLTEEATVEAVSAQATFVFESPNPDTEDLAKVMKMTKEVSIEGVDSWTDGWNHIIFNLKKSIGAELVDALPQVNTELDGKVDGTKVIQMDVYYDDTLDPNNRFDSLKARKDVWNSDPTKGYSIDLTLVNYADHQANHDGAGMHIGYQGYVVKANEWVTVTFDDLDYGRIANFFAAGDAEKLSPESKDVDAIKLIVGGGFKDTGSVNPIYFKNLRIVDVK